MKALFRRMLVAAAIALPMTAPDSATMADQAGLASSSTPCCSPCDNGSCDGLGTNGGLLAGLCCDSLSGCGHAGWGHDFASNFLHPSDRCFNDFISPMINFVYFEDPRNVTELRPIFAHHRVPDVIGAGVPAGGSIQLYAAQFRIALTDRLSLIAVKDGFIVDHTDGALDTLLGDGWADVTAGLKYNLIRDPSAGRLVSTGVTYEIPIGSQRALQDIGDGEFHFFLTGGQRLLDGNAHFLSAVGYRLAVDDAVQDDSIHWSNHLDYRVTERAYAFTEAAWWHWTDDAETGLALGAAGQDLFNLPATNVVGNDLVTQTVGMRFKPRSNIEMGTAYEFPLTNFKDVIDDRLIVDLILRY